MYSHLDELFGSLSTAFLTILLLSLVLRLTGYLFKALALSQMTKNAGLARPGLAWVPVANNYLLGTLCDRAVYFQRGRTRGFALLLPFWDALGLVFGKSLLAFLSNYEGWDTLLAYEGASLTYQWAGPLPLLRSFLAVTILASFGCALWYLYRDYDPARAVVLTILSLIFGDFAQGVILFVLRGRVPQSLRAEGWLPPEVFPSSPVSVQPPSSPPDPPPPEERRDGWYQPNEIWQRPYRLDSFPPEPPSGGEGPER